MKKAELREGGVGAVRLCPRLLNPGRMREQRGEEEKVGWREPGCQRWGSLMTWKPINWQSEMGRSGFLFIYTSILGTGFGPGVWLGESQLYCKCCVTSGKSLNVSGLRSTSNT